MSNQDEEKEVDVVEIIKDIMTHKKVFITGCYDMLHSGHIKFFREASQFGDLFVGIASDDTIHSLKGRKPIYSERERLYMVKSIRYVKDACINSGLGMMDFIESINLYNPDIFVVNEDGHTDEKETFCKERGIEYNVLKRISETGLTPRSTTTIRQDVMSQLPYRLEIAGAWIDQPYVSKLAPGWVLTISLEPTIDFQERCGMSTSTRNTAKKLWPYNLPDYNPEMLSKLLFCLDNEPQDKEHVSGAQDSIGICMPGLNRHYYSNNYWPEKIESCHDEEILSWLENHMCLVLSKPREPGVSVLEGANINLEDVKLFVESVDSCWDAIMRRDLYDFAKYFKASFDSQIKLFPAMMNDAVRGCIEEYKDRALAWKMSGAGGGGYIILVCEKPIEGSIRIKIRRRDIL